MEIARQICQTIRFRMEVIRDAPIAFQMFLPTRLCWEILRDSPPETKWLRFVADWLERHSGIDVSELVLSSGRISKPEWRTFTLNAAPSSPISNLDPVTASM